MKVQSTTIKIRNCANRARASQVFVDRKKKAAKRACRKKVS